MLLLLRSVLNMAPSSSVLRNVGSCLKM